MRKGRGTPVFMPPEILNPAFVGIPCKKTDIYSFGITLWELFAGEFAFEEYRTVDQLTRAVYNECAMPPKHKIPTELRNLVYSCISYDPNQRPEFEQCVSSIGEIILNHVISDESGIALWNQLGKDTDSFEAKKFLETLYSYFGFNPSKDLKKYVKTLLSDNDKVNIFNFGKFLLFFGPIVSTAADGSQFTFLDRIEKFKSCNFFYPQITTPVAEGKMCTKTNGYFLLRLSTSNPGYFTITRKYQGRVDHLRIKWDNKTNESIYKKNDKVVAKENCEIIDFVSFLKNQLNLRIPLQFEASHNPEYLL